MINNVSCPGLYRMLQAADGRICRIKLDLGRLTLQQMHVLANTAEQYGNSIIEITTRGNVQLRGIAENNQQKLVNTLIDCGLGPLTRAGDDIRNVMVNPTAGFDRYGSGFITGFAEELLQSLQTSPDYQKLSPKFSFYIDGGEACAVLDHHSDIWLSLTDDDSFFVFGIASCLPVTDDDTPALGMIARERGSDIIVALLDCLLFAARQNSAIQRMKHLVAVWGYERIFNCLQQIIPEIVPAHFFRRKVPLGCFDLGVHKNCFPDRYYLGIKPRLGRFTPSLLRNVADISFRLSDSKRLQVTPWQGLVFPDCSYGAAKSLAVICHDYGMIVDKKEPYANILCCTGSPGCNSALSDVQADAHKLAASWQLYMVDNMQVHLVACPKSCTATQAKPVTLLARQKNFYDIYYRDKNAKSKFGRRIAAHVDINNVIKILSAECRKSVTGIQGFQLLNEKHEI